MADTTETLIATFICCADHDHATDPACEYKAEKFERPLTAAEIADREASAKAFADQQAADEAAAKAAAEAKASAEAKLAALGLTGDEIAALTK
jgi:hypothetical protein